MTSRRAYSAAALAVCFFLFLPACRQEKIAPPPPPPPAAHTILLSDNNGNCEQRIDGAAVPVAIVNVHWGDSVTFTAGPGHTYALNFVAPNVSCASPFQGTGTCRTNFSDAAVTSGQSGNETYSYGSLQIDGKACNLNPPGGQGPMGMRMRP